MKNYTLRIITTPITDSWEKHYMIIDYLSGSSLVENPESPEIICDINAYTWQQAQMFIMGLADINHLTVAAIYRINEIETEGELPARYDEIIEHWTDKTINQQ